MRSDAWTKQEDVFLKETVIEHIRNGSTQLKAFEEIAEKLDRTAPAVGFRWNAEVRQRYNDEVQQAKRERNQSKRLYNRTKDTKIMNFNFPLQQDFKENGSELSLELVIDFLKSLNKNQNNASQLKKEIGILQETNNRLVQENDRLKNQVERLSTEQTNIQEDYETLIQIMNRARKMVVLDEGEECKTPKFRMDKNGNLEKIAN